MIICKQIRFENGKKRGPYKKRYTNYYIKKIA